MLPAGMDLVACAVVNGRNSPRISRAQVHFLATSVRGGEGHNEDVYPATISLPVNGGETTLARLIYEFTLYRRAIPLQTLRSEATMVRLRHEYNCDSGVGDMPSRTAPGDLSTIFWKRTGVQPPPSWPVEKNEVLPCYRIERN